MASDSNGSKTITLSLDGKDQSISLPVLDGSVGPDVVDIRKLYGEALPRFGGLHMVALTRLC